MKPNIKTISELTGFSQATVSNVLNNKKNVKRTTAEQILKAAREIGYLEANRIDNVRVVMYKKSGIVLTETPLINDLLEGVEAEAQKNGLSTIVCSLKEGESDFKNKLDEILSSRNSGIILLATEMDYEDVKPFEVLKDRLVVVDACFREGLFDYILMDNFNAFYNAASYVIEKGHRSIQMIDSTIEIRNFASRRCGFACCLAEHGLEVTAKSFIKLHPTMAGAYRDMQKYLADKPKIPSAFCAVNDIIAVGAMKALQEAGYRIPEDISVIGFDNMPYGEVASPGLTTVNILKREMGELAVQRLLEKLNTNEQVPLLIHLLTTIVERQSVAEK